MKPIVMFTYSIVAYLIGFASLLLWILSLSDFVPQISIDRNPETDFPFAIAKDIGLLLLFVIPHSLMARKPFKAWITRVVPQPIERSTYVLQSGLLLTLLVTQWEPLGGNIWTVAEGTIGYFVVYFLFFTGWIILFISTFLINHFDLFGLRQTFLELLKKPYTPLDFKIIGFYKFVRHPLYFGIILGMWSAPVMTTSHLVTAILLTIYIVVGATLEESDLMREFAVSYQAYRKKTPMLIPFLRKEDNSSQT